MFPCCWLPPPNGPPDCSLAAALHPSQTGSALACSIDGRSGWTFSNLHLWHGMYSLQLGPACSALLPGNSWRVARLDARSAHASSPVVYLIPKAWRWEDLLDIRYLWPLCPPCPSRPAIPGTPLTWRKRRREDPNSTEPRWALSAPGHQQSRHQQCAAGAFAGLKARA